MLCMWMRKKVQYTPPNGEKNRNELEQKMEALIWKMNMFFVCVVCVVVGCVFMYAVMK